MVVVIQVVVVKVRAVVNVVRLAVVVRQTIPFGGSSSGGGGSC